MKKQPNTNSRRINTHSLGEVATVVCNTDTTMEEAILWHGGEAETMWYDAAQIYRSWVLPHSTWTQRGPLSQRDEFTHGGWGDVDWWMHSTVTFSLPMAVDPPDVIANNSLALCEQLDACDSLAFNCENNLCLSCVPSRRAR